MRGGDPHPQRRRQDPEAQRRVQSHGLAVDARGDRAVCVNLERGRGPLSPGTLEEAPARSRRGSNGDPQQPVVDPRPGARADRAPEAVAVVGDEDRRAGGVLVPSGPGPAQVQPLALGSQHLGQRVEDGPQLRLPIALALDGLGVEADRDVVDEYAAVDLGEVDPPLATADEGIERADDVVAVDPEVEREVVAGPGRDTGIGQILLGGDHGNDGLGAVAAGHRQRVGSIGHRAAHELLEVGAELQLDRLDARARASSARWNFSAFPPPDLGL